MKVILIEEVVKVVKEATVTVTMPEREAHSLLEALNDFDVSDNVSAASPLYKLWEQLYSEIGQR